VDRVTINLAIRDLYCVLTDCFWYVPRSGIAAYDSSSLGFLRNLHIAFCSVWTIYIPTHSVSGKDISLVAENIEDSTLI
jgi:hypothetical protein